MSLGRIASRPSDRQPDPCGNEWTDDEARRIDPLAQRRDDGEQHHECGDEHESLLSGRHGQIVPATAGRWTRPRPRGGSLPACRADRPVKARGDRRAHRAALAMKKAEGVALGKPSPIPADVRARILQSHRAGRSYSAIARALDADGVPTPGGSARWHHSVVASVLRRDARSVPALRDLNRDEGHAGQNEARGDDLRRGLVGDEEDDHEADHDDDFHAPQPPRPTPEATAQHGAERTRQAVAA